MNKTPKSKAGWEIRLEQKRYEDSILRERLDAATGDVFNTPQELVRRLQLNDTPPESERQILRCAPAFDEKAEHEADLRYESRVDYESWQYDGPAEMEAE